MALREYHLHKGDYGKLQFDVHEAQPYIQRNGDHCIKPHRHSYYQLIWFSTKGKHFVDYKEYAHPPNSIFFLSKGQVHSFDPKCDNEGYLFHFNDTFHNISDHSISSQILFRLFEHKFVPFVTIPNESANHFKFLSRTLFREFEQKTSNYKIEVLLYFQLILVQILKLLDLQNGSMPTDKHFEKALQFKREVLLHLDKFETVNQYSKRLGVSEKTLGSITKKYFNSTPGDLVLREKILEAKRMLSNKNLSIKEVAFRLGFDQATYFTKYFKREVGLTPKQFQKEVV